MKVFSDYFSLLKFYDIMGVYNIMIVIGAGLSGCVIAREMAEKGHKVDVYEKKAHIGGAVYDYKDTNGIFIQRYGPHILHTNLEAVYEFIQKHGKWNIFEHKVLGNVCNKLCPIPFNLKSIETCFTPAKAYQYKKKLIEHIGEGKTITIGELINTDDEDLKQLANFIYENIFHHYSKKQWGVAPNKLGSNITGRVPVRASYKDGYFEDKYQLIPQEGYTSFLANLLDHKNINLHLNSNAKNLIRIKESDVYFYEDLYDDNIVYTGCIDYLLDYKYGELPYRTIRFEFERQYWPYQPVAVVNHPNAPKFTRITEFGHFYPEHDYKVSVIMREYPEKYKKDSDLEPYYPIHNEQNNSIYQIYANELCKVHNLHLAGRLGKYRYLNMDVAILESLNLVDSIKNR